MLLNDKQKLIISQCKKSVTYFINSCCKVKHPSIGITSFKTFKYQQKALAEFRNSRFNIFKKCRQSGISTLTGSYALWYGMFHSNKTILIVSKRDEDAMAFLDRNVRFAYDNLPEWMRKLWPIKANEHKIQFPNGSSIKSLTASPDTLRSNAASLNIIDESGFIKDMETMWAGGWSTLQHGGQVIIISTPNGIGNWYWGTWASALDKSNDFNPIEINWWDMDWVLEYRDPVSGKTSRIAPCDGIRECTTKEDIEKYGPYWSPWLEGEYRGLQQRGEAHLFRQEVLAEFLGSGGTILSPAVIRRIGKMVAEGGKHSTFSGPTQYIHPISGEEETLDFTGSDPAEGLWLWDKPVVPVPAEMRGSRIIREGKPGHSYVMGVDTATGANRDYSTIEIFDLNTMSQVAEYMGHVQSNVFSKMVDYLGRWYNNALACVERTGVGSGVIEDLSALAYPNMWRKIKRLPDGQHLGPYGFATTDASKPTLNKALIEFISENDGEGYTVYSSRLWKQFQIYIRKKNRSGTDTKKTGAQDGKGNYDDLVIACALAFIAIQDVVDQDPRALIPIRGNRIGDPDLTIVDMAAHQKSLISTNDPNVLMPYTKLDDRPLTHSIDQQIERFTEQLGHARPKSVPAVVTRRKHAL